MVTFLSVSCSPSRLDTPLTLGHLDDVDTMNFTSQHCNVQRQPPQTVIGHSPPRDI